MSRLIVVSNRVIGHTPDSHAAGGLSVGVANCLEERGGIWFGWSGKISHTASSPHINIHNNVTYATLDLSEQDHQDYYNGFANSTLWPCFHYRIDHLCFDTRQYSGYRRVNQKWARQLKALLKPDDLIWVHDYHLIPFARYCREMGIRNRIGFFLHVPFPAAEIFSRIPCGDELLLDLCHYDLVGFHTDSYRLAFLRCLDMLLDSFTLSLAGRNYGPAQIQSGVFPMGIDHSEVGKQAERAEKGMSLDWHSEDHQLIISVDRLDYSKGLLERLSAYECFLDRYAEHAGRISYLQVVPDCRLQNPVYRKLRDNLHDRLREINGRFPPQHRKPLRYISDTLQRHEVAALLRQSQVGLITPLCDGMNLLAKEYVAAQNPAAPGVLVLSRFAGAAAELKAALLVNPMDRKAVAAALHQALHMPHEERRQRHEELMTALHRNPISRWADDFLEALCPQPLYRPLPEPTNTILHPASASTF